MRSILDKLSLQMYPLPQQQLEQLLTPALLIFLDHVRSNLNRVIDHHLDGDVNRWRPHVKTAKIPEVFVEMAQAGVRNFKCATTREASVLLTALDEGGFEHADLLVAYPHVEPALSHLGGLARRYPQFSIAVTCEDPETASAMPGEVDVFLDIDSGMNRTGIPLTERQRMLDIIDRADKRFRGLHFYEGHLANLIPEQRQKKTEELFDRLHDLVGFLISRGVRIGEILTSGTPTFRDVADLKPLATLDGEFTHRLSPGTVVYHDGRSDAEVPDLNLTPAALVLSRVVSVPDRRAITCDAGSKSLAAEAGDPCAVAVGFPGLTARTPSEEHLPMHVNARPAPSRGDFLLLVPWHVCPTVNLAEQAVLIEGGELRAIVPVAARAHELVI